MNESMTQSLTELPSEIVQQIFKFVPNELKQTCKQFYVMYNDFYMNLFIAKFGPHILRTIALYDLPYLINYIKSFDYWRYYQRELVAKYYHLTDNNATSKSVNEILNCKYIRDSWKIIYGIYRNRRLFVDYNDYQVDEPSYIRENLLYVNKTYLIKYNKRIKLTPGLYNLSCGVIIQNSLGLSSTNFKVIEGKSGRELLSFFPASNINDLVPHKKFVLLDLGSFEVAKPKIMENLGEYAHEEQFDNLVDIDIIMEESGLFMKSGFVICFIDVNAYQMKDTERDGYGKLVAKEKSWWLAWSIDNQKPEPKNLINLLLKRLYESINNSMMLLTSSDVPFQQMGSFAEANENDQLEIDTSLNDETLDDRVNIERNVDLETYNRNFYSKVNEQGQLITRTFKFITVLDRRRFESSVVLSDSLETSKNFFLYSEPLKWKLTTILEL